MIHTHSVSPPGVGETLLRNLLVNSSAARLGRRVRETRGTPLALGLVALGRLDLQQPAWGKSQTPLPKPSTLVLPVVPYLSRYPRPSEPHHLFPRTRSLAPSLGVYMRVSVCHTFFFPGVPCFIIILITVVLSFMLPLTFIFGLVMLFICL